MKVKTIYLLDIILLCFSICFCPSRLCSFGDGRQIPKLSFDESCYHPGFGFWLERNAFTGPILWLFICYSIINSALPRLKTDPWRQKVENVKICEILIKARTNESLATNMQKANDDGPILQIYKLKSRKKFSLYYTHDIFSSLDDTFCASTQNCPLWVTNSVRKKFVILV